jgi:hypothetical protein
MVMKNLYLISTDKPSRLFKDIHSSLWSIRKYYDEPLNEATQNQHIYITSDEEIKEGDRMYYKHFGEDIVCKYDTMNGQNTNVNEHKPFYQKIILTTDGDLIKDGVQAIDDEFLEWFVKNPSCESIEVEDEGCQKWINPEELKPTKHKYIWISVYKIIIPKEEPKQETVFENAKLTLRKHILENKEQVIKDLDEMREQSSKQKTLEEAAEKYVKNEPDTTLKLISKYSFKDGAKYMAERMYSEEDMIKFALFLEIHLPMKPRKTHHQLLEQFKKK